MTKYYEKIGLLTPYDPNVDRDVFIINNSGSFPVSITLYLRTILFMLNKDRQYLTTIKIFDDNGAVTHQDSIELNPEKIKINKDSLVDNNFTSGFTLTSPNIVLVKQGTYKVQLELIDKDTNKLLDTATTFILARPMENNN